MEIDIDDEIENVKSSYENELKCLNEYAKQITINVCQEDFRKVDERYSKKEIIFPSKKRIFSE
jgi:hypothetical protein